MAKIADFVRQAFPSMMRSIVTEIYLCRTCSRQEILRMEMARQVSQPLALLFCLVDAAQAERPTTGGADLAEEEGVGRYQLVSAHPRRVLSDPRPA